MVVKQGSISLVKSGQGNVSTVKSGQGVISTAIAKTGHIEDAIDVAPVAWVPSSLGVRWLLAYDAENANLPADGEEALTWDDESGNGHQMVYEAGHRGIMRTRNGNRYLDSNPTGSDTTQGLISLAKDLAPSAGSYSIFIVFKDKGLTAINTEYLMDLGTSTRLIIANRANVGGFDDVGIWFNGGGWTNAILADTDLHILEVLVSSDHGKGGVSGAFLFLDGYPLGNRSRGNFDVESVLAVAGDPLAFPGYQLADSAFVGGELYYAAIVHNPTLQDRTEYANWLEARYSVGVPVWTPLDINPQKWVHSADGAFTDVESGTVTEINNKGSDVEELPVSSLPLYELSQIAYNGVDAHSFSIMPADDSEWFIVGAPTARANNHAIALTDDTSNVFYFTMTFAINKSGQTGTDMVFNVIRRITSDIQFFVDVNIQIDEMVVVGIRLDAVEGMIININGHDYKNGDPEFKEHSSSGNNSQWIGDHSGWNRFNINWLERQTANSYSDFILGRSGFLVTPPLSDADRTRLIDYMKAESLEELYLLRDDFSTGLDTDKWIDYGVAVPYSFASGFLEFNLNTASNDNTAKTLQIGSAETFSLADHPYLVAQFDVRMQGYSGSGAGPFMIIGWSDESEAELNVSRIQWLNEPDNNEIDDSFRILAHENSGTRVNIQNIAADLTDWKTFKITFESYTSHTLGRVRFLIWDDVAEAWDDVGGTSSMVVLDDAEMRFYFNPKWDSGDQAVLFGVRNFSICSRNYQTQYPS